MRKVRERDGEGYSSHWFTPQWPGEWGLDQSEAKVRWVAGTRDLGQL